MAHFNFQKGAHCGTGSFDMLEGYPRFSELLSD